MVRRGDRNEELRYSIRALVAHLPHDRIWVAGYKPRWLEGVGYLPTKQAQARYVNSRMNLLAACRADVSDRFVLFHDDFFILEPMESVPTAHRGPVSEVLQGRKDTPYQRGLGAALELLRSWNYPEPLDYELHLPLEVDREQMRTTIERTLEEHPIVASAIRTLHGNLWGLGGERVEDVKVRAAREPMPTGMSFVSTTDANFKFGKVGEYLRRRFPDPSPYEVPA